MRLLLFSLFAIGLALIQFSATAAWPGAPDLCLALAALAMVQGRDDGYLLRLICLGAAADAFDPGSTAFHLIAFTAAGALCSPLRGVLFPRTAVGLGVTTAVLLLVVRTADAVLCGGPLPGAAILIAMASTAAAAVAFALIIAALPNRVHLLGRAGAHA